MLSSGYNKGLLATFSWDGDQLVVLHYEDEFAEEGFLCYYKVVVPAGSVLGRKGPTTIDEVGHLAVSDKK